MKKSLQLSLPAASILLTACATQTGWTPTVDPYSPPRDPYYQPPQYNQTVPPAGYNQPAYDPNQELANRYQRDLAECKQLALQSSGGTATETAKGAVVGGLLGAAGGAAIGAITGSPGKGAAIGAAAGGIGGGAKQGIEAEDQYKRAYINCMRNRGHNVVD